MRPYKYNIWQVKLNTVADFCKILIFFNLKVTFEDLKILRWHHLWFFSCHENYNLSNRQFFSINILSTDAPISSGFNNLQAMTIGSSSQQINISQETDSRGCNDQARSSLHRNSTLMVLISKLKVSNLKSESTQTSAWVSPPDCALGDQKYYLVWKKREGWWLFGFAAQLGNMSQRVLVILQ